MQQRIREIWVSLGIFHYSSSGGMILAIFNIRIAGLSMKSFVNPLSDF